MRAQETRREKAALGNKFTYFSAVPNRKNFVNFTSHG